MDDLENLLNLHGEVFPMDNGYWIKFEAYQVEPKKSMEREKNHMIISINRWI